METVYLLLGFSLYRFTDSELRCYQVYNTRTSIAFEAKKKQLLRSGDEIEIVFSKLTYVASYHPCDTSIVRTTECTAVVSRFLEGSTNIYI